MIDLPFNPDDLGETTLLAQYLRADSDRLPVLCNILALLDDDGRVGDHARYYVVRNAGRRGILRGVLIALGIPLPSWLYEAPGVATLNRQFVASHREQFNQHKRQMHGANALPLRDPFSTRRRARPKPIEDSL